MKSIADFHGLRLMGRSAGQLGVTEMKSIKEQCEAIWRSRDFGSRTAVNVWTEHRISISDRMSESVEGLWRVDGETRAPSVGKSAEKFMRKVRKHWGPPPMTYCGDAKPKCPDWLRERYKRECPNNASELIRLYGRLDAIDIALASKTWFEVTGEPL